MQMIPTLQKKGVYFLVIERFYLLEKWWTFFFFNLLYGGSILNQNFEI